jgi:hypothetical protein
MIAPENATKKHEKAMKTKRFTDPDLGQLSPSMETLRYQKNLEIIQ